MARARSHTGNGGQAQRDRAGRDERPARPEHRDVVVIGGGPAGAAAAIQLKRGGLRPLLIERDRIGGLLREAHLIENYPGFPGGIAGCDLADLIEAQVGRAGVEVAHEEAVRLWRGEGVHWIRTAPVPPPLEGQPASEEGVPAHRNEPAPGAAIAGRGALSPEAAPAGRVLTAERVVVASGTAPNVLRGVMIFGVPRGRIHYGVRGLESVSGGRIAVIGGGDAAFDYALSLSERSDVVILHRGDRPRCIPVLEERCAASARIIYRPNEVVEEIVVGKDGVKVRLAVGEGIGREWIAADHVVVAIGRAPRLDFLSAGMRERTEEFQGAEPLYLIGDVASGDFRQAAISAGDGVRTAMEILERCTGARWGTSKR